MPGIDTGAPERTLTSRGSAGSPNRRPTRSPSRSMCRRSSSSRPAGQLAAEIGQARLGGDRETVAARAGPGGGHHDQVGALAAEQALQLGRCQRRRVIEVIDEAGGRLFHATWIIIDDRCIA
jgi:hypothetical protein